MEESSTSLFGATQQMPFGHEKILPEFIRFQEQKSSSQILESGFWSH